MKTWQMIKELTENPKKKFAVICDDTEEGTTISVDCEEFIIKGCKNLFVDDEWKEVKHPVSFMEAVASGKCIKPGGGDSYETLSRLLYILADEYTDEFIAHVLTTGEFYTED